MRQKKIDYYATINEKIENYERGVISGSSIDIDNRYRNIVGKLDNSKTYENKLIQFVDSENTEGKGLIFVEDRRTLNIISQYMQRYLIG